MRLGGKPARTGAAVMALLARMPGRRRPCWLAHRAARRPGGHEGRSAAARRERVPGAGQPGGVRERGSPEEAEPGDGRLRPRPTGSRAHQRYVASVQKHLGRIEGASVREIPYEFDSWQAGSQSLKADGRGDARRRAGSLRRVHPQGRSQRRARLRPEGHRDHRAERRRARSSCATPPRPACRRPRSRRSSGGHTTPTSRSPRRSARTTSATTSPTSSASPTWRPRPTPAPPASCFVHCFPREQVRDHYAPYEGVHWEIPAAAGRRRRGRAAQGARRRAARRATLTLSGTRGPAPTKTLVATLPGMSEERLVVAEPHRRHERRLGQRPDRDDRAWRSTSPRCRRSAARARSSSSSPPRTCTSA